MKRVGTLILLVLLSTAEPLLRAQTSETYTFTTNRLVPDGNLSGLSDVRNINSAIGTITSLKVRLKLTGEFNGDLYGYLRHSSGFTVLLNRPGKTASVPWGYPDSGLDVTFQTGAVNDDIHLYRNVMTPADGSPLTGIWQPDGRTDDPLNFTEGSSRVTSLANFNGLNAAGEWTLFLADVDSGGTNMLTGWALEITGTAYPTLAWANPADIVYGTALDGTQLNATAVYDSTNVPGTFTYTRVAGTKLNAGPGQAISVTFTPTDTTSFLPVSTNLTINVLKAPLTITANSANKIYGEALPAFSAGYSGFVNDDTAESLDTPVTLGTTATDSSPAGGYTITASGAVDANYTITHVNGLLTIGRALTTGTIGSSANPARPGANVTWTMTLNAVAPGVGTPSGTVNYRIDGSLAGSGTLSGGVAVFMAANLAVGAHTIVAEYAGDSNFAGATNTLASDQVINTPPVAGNDIIERDPLTGAKVLLSTLLANDSDADGDILSITVCSLSASNATITVSGGWVFYTPQPGFTNADWFTYTINDGRGDSATGTVTVGIRADNSPGLNLTIADLGNGSYRINGSGIVGRTYRLQFSDTLSPFNWQDLPGGSVTADGIGQFHYIDASGAPTRFYRSVTP